MIATRILSGLETLDLTGAEADAAARQGFLEWVFAMPGEVTPQAVREALQAPEAWRAESDAAQAFVAYLSQAQKNLAHPETRRIRRARRLH